MASNPTIRTRRTQERYLEAQRSRPADYGCPLCKAPTVTEFNHWRLIRNDFPYDLVAKQHDMLIPKRHVTEQELTPEEVREYATLKNQYVEENGYTFIMEATHGAKSVPAHHHLHLVTLKDELAF